MIDVSNLRSHKNQIGKYFVGIRLMSMRGWVNSVIIFRSLQFVKCKQKQMTPKLSACRKWK